MRTRTADELRAWANELETQINDLKNTDDPKWLQRWAGRMRRLADKKENALIHKDRQR